MTDKKIVLVTGATGNVGSNLIPILFENGFEIRVLARKKIAIKNATVFLWNVDKMQADSNAFQNIEFIIHLAGEGIADKKWTVERKKQIIDSRVNSAKLLYQCTVQNKVKLKKFISASAVGFYGANASNKFYTEIDHAGNDFLADCCTKWEAAADEFSNLCNVTKIRLGVVLCNNGGAFPKLIAPIKFGFAAALGKGNQPLPWIHIDDVCNIFKNSICNENMIGIYNAVSPEYQCNRSFTSIASNILKRPYFMPNVPSFILKFIFGEMSLTFLNGQKVLPQKLIDEKFNFKFDTLEKALKDLTK